MFLILWCQACLLHSRNTGSLWIHQSIWRGQVSYTEEKVSEQEDEHYGAVSPIPGPLFSRKPIGDIKNAFLKKKKEMQKGYGI